MTGTDGAGAPRSRLTRGRGGDKVIAGVCHGAGRYFGVDPVIFRVVLAVLALTGGIGLIAYGLGWLVVPQEGERESEAHRLLSGRIEGAPLTAVLTALVGCGLYASTIGNGTKQAFSLVLLAATAGAVYWSYQRRRLEAAGDLPAPGAGPGGATRVAAAVPDAPPAVQAPPEPGGTPSWWREPLGKAPGYLWGPADGDDDAGRYRPQAPGARSGRTDRPRAERPEYGWLFGLTVFLLAVGAAAVGTGVSWPYQPAGVAVEIGLASALGVFGTAFLVASFAGRARGGTVLFSLVTIAGLIGTAMLPKFGQGVGTTTWRPLTAAAVQPSYERGAGRGLLDLTGIPLTGGTISTRLKIGAGEAELRLPPGATARIDYDLGVGDVELSEPSDGEQRLRVKSKRHGTLTLPALPTVTAPAGGTAGRGTAGGGETIVVEVNVGVGQLKVVR